MGLDLKEFGGQLHGEESARVSRPPSNAQTYENVRALQASVNALAAISRSRSSPPCTATASAAPSISSCACDIRLASADAVFSVRETKVAIVADLGTLQRLPRIVGAGSRRGARLHRQGHRRAARCRDWSRELSCTARAPTTSRRRPTRLAHEIAANSPLAVRGTKAVLAANEGRSVDEGLDFVARWNTMYLASNDLAEAMSAFIEHRSPTFRGD